MLLHGSLERRVQIQFRGALLRAPNIRGDITAPRPARLSLMARWASTLQSSEAVAGTVAPPIGFIARISSAGQTRMLDWRRGITPPRMPRFTGRAGREGEQTLTHVVAGGLYDRAGVMAANLDATATRIDRAHPATPF